MTTKKNLNVPRNYTHSSEIKIPMENMITGTIRKSTNGKKPTSFSIDPELLIRFKAGCVYNNRPMSSVIEELMLQYVNSMR